jgi:hypothetical protein
MQCAFFSTWAAPIWKANLFSNFLRDADPKSSLEAAFLLGKGESYLTVLAYVMQYPRRVFGATSNWQLRRQ